MNKPTFTGLFTSFDSFVPLSYERGLVYTLLDCYFKICSSFHHFHAEVLKLKKFLLMNCYPEIFLHRLFCPPTKDSDSPPKNVIYFKLPYTGSHALQIQTQVSKLCSSAFPKVTLRFIFQSGRRLSGFFPFKDRTPMLMRSRVVYKYTCQCCGALYLGQTRRHLHTRISEHMGVSPLTGKKRATTSFPTSSIQAHTRQTNHAISPKDFSIISSCRSSSNFELLIHESLLISKYKPSLNENISSTPLSLFFSLSSV